MWWTLSPLMILGRTVYLCGLGMIVIGGIAGFGLANGDAALRMYELLSPLTDIGRPAAQFLGLSVDSATAEMGKTSVLLALCTVGITTGLLASMLGAHLWERAPNTIQPQNETA